MNIYSRAKTEGPILSFYECFSASRESAPDLMSPGLSWSLDREQTEPEISGRVSGWSKRGAALLCCIVCTVCTGAAPTTLMFSVILSSFIMIFPIPFIYYQDLV